MCQGTGQRHDEYVDGRCNGCNGEGKRRAQEREFSFDATNRGSLRSFVSRQVALKSGETED
jgi:hypothetical protein